MTTHITAQFRAPKPATGPAPPATQSVLRAASPTLQHSEREGGQSPIHSAEIKNAWIHTSNPPYAPLEWWLLHHRANQLWSSYWNYYATQFNLVPFSQFTCAHIHTVHMRPHSLQIFLSCCNICGTLPTSPATLCRFDAILGPLSFALDVFNCI
jgi:hypothetical protein